MPVTIRRRELIAAIGGAAVAWPLAARAQQADKVWRIGFLAGGSRPVSSDFNPYSGFLRGMRELGYVEGKDFIVEWRFAEGRFELLSDLATELVRLKVDAIVLGTSQAVRPAQQATSTIPIVMGSSTDPVGMGYVASFARPGGNTTGLASSQEDIAPKQVELLSMLVPNLTRIGFLLNPNDLAHPLVLKIAQDAAQNAGLALVPVELGDQQGIANAFATLAHERVGALMSSGDPLFFSLRHRIAEMALQARLPTMFAQREYVEAGALMSYGESLADFYRRAAFYVDKIFKGAKPTELPIQQPTRFFLVINRKAAEAIGITIPLQVLVLADDVIE